MKDTYNIIYLKLVKLWLVSTLIFLPFQAYIANLYSRWISSNATIIYYLDEITVVVFSFLAFVEHVKCKSGFPNLFLLVSPLILICICGIISTLINGNSLLVTILGTFDYIKNFLAIFIYAVFFRTIPEFKRVFQHLFNIAIFFGIIALIQFTWAMGSVYILGKSITDESVYIFSNLYTYDTVAHRNDIWRYGIFRANAIVAGTYVLGLYNLLILTIYFYTARKMNIKGVIPIISGIIACASRMVYGGIIFVLSLRFLKARTIIILILISITVMTAFIVMNEEFSIPEILQSYMPINEEGIDMNNIRMYTRHKAIEIWSDHPFWGVGAGMFGGIVASKYNSYIYQEYNVSQLKYIVSIGGIEQFWFQVLAELGIMGVLIYCSLFINLFVMFYILRKQADGEEVKGLFSALMVYLGCILIYSLGSGINIAPCLYVYCAFAGIGLGCVQSQLIKEI